MIRKDLVWYIILGLIVAICFGSIISIAFIPPIWAVAVGVFGWVVTAIVCMVLVLKIQQLRYARTNLTNALTTGMEIAHKLGEQQFINHQLLNEREQMFAMFKVIPKKKKKIKN